MQSVDGVRASLDELKETVIGRKQTTHLKNKMMVLRHVSYPFCLLWSPCCHWSVGSMSWSPKPKNEIVQCVNESFQNMRYMSDDDST